MIQLPMPRYSPCAKPRRPEGNYRLVGATLYVHPGAVASCAPARWSSRVFSIWVFGARDLRFGGVRSKFALADSDLLNHRLQITEGILGAECAELLKTFFEARR